MEMPHEMLKDAAHKSKRVKVIVCAPGRGCPKQVEFWNNVTPAQFLSAAGFNQATHNLRLGMRNLPGGISFRFWGVVDGECLRIEEKSLAERAEFAALDRLCGELDARDAANGGWKDLPWLSEA
jgi:hypothetical protein